MEKLVPIFGLFYNYGLDIQLKSYFRNKLIYNGKMCVSDRMGDLDLLGDKYIGLVNSLPHDKLVLEEKVTWINNKIEVVIAAEVNKVYKNASLTAAQVSDQVSLLMANKQSMLVYMAYDVSNLGIY